MTKSAETSADQPEVSRSERIAELRRLLANQSYHVDLDTLAERVAKDVLRKNVLKTKH